MEMMGSRDGEILFEDINFDDLFEGLEDGNILPGLEIDPLDIFADFSFSSGEQLGNLEKSLEEDGNWREDCKESSREEVEVVSARTKEDGNESLKASVKGSKASSHGKKKVKVDWTPELHRRFVQAVEQLGVDKAVPSRILELMGIDCLTRHNIASHLQKYRSHRNHLLTREAEAASWSQRRQMYRTSAAVHGRGATKTNTNPNWGPPPIMGFPPPMYQPPLVRPLHVWGHPSVEQPQLVPVWPRPPWGPPQPTHGVLTPDSSYWHRPYYQRPLTQGTPCFPAPLMPAMRFPTPPVHGIPPHPMYRPASPPIKKSSSQARLDAQPSNESIDAAIGDVLAKPWLPLPLGLKPPSLDSVMVELQKQGVPKVP